MATITREATVNILQKAFPGMRSNEAREMVAGGTIRQIPANTVICKEGAIESSFYVILEGEVGVTKLINENEVRFLKHLKPGDFFGEMSIIHDAPRSATITTNQPTTVLEISKDVFTEMLQRSSGMSLAMVREVSQRLAENNEMAIADLRKKAEQLKNAYDQLKEIEKARSEFLATIAHELRTPLQAATGFLKMIQSGKLSGESLNMALEIISRNLQDIVSTTNNILFLQEMDLILPEFQPTDIGAVVLAAVESEHAYAERNRVGIRLNIAPNLPLCQADAQSLERAFSAILNNAIKFSPCGSEVDVQVSFENASLLIKIIDRGTGIEPEILPRIFDRFFHIDKIGDQVFRGAGLGLSIAQQVIEQHHGTIRVQSSVGHGSTFTVTLKPI